MTKSTLHTLAAIAIGIASMVAISSCTDDDIAGGGGGGSTPFDPNIDQMTVKVEGDVPTAVISTFDDKSMGAALQRRLSKTSSSIQGDTKMVLIKGEDIKSRPITEWLEAAKLYLKGGYIAVEKPHDAHLVEVMEKLSAHFAKASYDILIDDDGSGIEIEIVEPNDESGNSLNAVNAEAERFKARIANAKSLSSKSSSDVKPVAEMVIFSRRGFYQCAPYEETTITIHGSGETTPVTETIRNEYNKYTSGLLADGAAKWMNNHAPTQSSSKSSIISKADGGDAINEIMSASEEHTYQCGLNAGVMCKIEDGKYRFEYHTKPQAYQEIIRVWGVHNMTKNNENGMDYYNVQQHILASIGGKREDDSRYDSNKTLYSGPFEENKWTDVYSGIFEIDGWSMTSFYGSWFEEGNYSMSIKGNGEITLEDAAPDTDNNTVSRTVAVGETSSQTNTIGATVTGIFSSNPGASISGMFTHGWTTGSTYTVSWTDNVKELKCAKNTEGTKVSWTYKNGRDMMQGDGDEHILVPDILVSDVNIDNQVCWSVKNPSDAYTVEIHHPCILSCLGYQTGDHGGNDDKKQARITANGDAKENVSFTMLTPNRAKQIWHMDVDFPEIGQPGHEGQKGLLTQYLQNQFPEIYQPMLELADQTQYSENTIMYIVDASKQMLYDPNALATLQGYAKDMGISQFTIKWYNTDRDDNNKELHKSFKMTIKAN